MPDKAIESAPTPAIAVAPTRSAISRRDLLKAGAAGVALASMHGLEVRASPDTATRMLNRGSIAEFGDVGAGSPVLTSFRNAATQYEWLTPAKSYAPTLQYSNGTGPSWQPRPLQSAPGAVTLRATAGGVRGSAPALEARLELAAYADTGAFRWQQTFQNTGTSSLSNVSRISALDLDLKPDLGRIVVHCVRRDGDYTREALPFKSRLEVAGGDWNAPIYTGLIVIEAVGRSEFLVIGVQQERGWTFALEQLQERLQLRVMLHDMQKTVAPRATLAACPIFIGACGGDLDAAVNLALEHLRARILPPALDRAPWVSYNIWSTDGKDVEKNILDEIPFAASMGVDLFYLDASWYRNSSTRGSGDWGKGIGSYVEDRNKFPQGLRHLSDQVHAAGMKFGLWVGPNIVDAALVPHEIPLSWLAMVDGKQAELKIPTWENTCLQVCMGSTGYAEHLRLALANLVEAYNLDWIKWDNSGIPALPARCNRSDHGHNRDDGSSTALANEYAIFDYLHTRFPHLALEQCGYGSRLDYGLAGSIRANWCSDSCYPASRLRANSLVCASVFPAACNAAWIVSEDTELFGAKTHALVDAAIRSRMLGLFGVGTLNGQMSQRASLYPQNVRDRLSVNVRLYKEFRHLLFQQVSYPFQPYGTDPQGWQAIQFTDVQGAEAVLLCFRAASTQTTARLPVGRLHPQKSYQLRCVDAGTQATMSGKELLEDGIYLSLPEAGASEIVRISAA